MEALLDATFQTLRAIQSLAWVPLLLLWLKIDEAPKITLIAIGAYFQGYPNFVAGIQNVDRKLVEVGGIYGVSGYRLIARIFLPAALPNLFTGLRTGLALSWMFLVAAELIAATRGLGYLLTDGRETGRADPVIVAIVVLALLGKTSDRLLRWLEGRLLGWRDALDSRPFRGIPPCHTICSTWRLPARISRRFASSKMSALASTPAKSSAWWNPVAAEEATCCASSPVSIPVTAVTSASTASTASAFA